MYIYIYVVTYIYIYVGHIYIYIHTYVVIYIYIYSYIYIYALGLVTVSPYGSSRAKQEVRRQSLVQPRVFTMGKAVGIEDESTKITGKK